jgi:hypothetical protein
MSREYGLVCTGHDITQSFRLSMRSSETNCDDAYDEFSNMLAAIRDEFPDLTIAEIINEPPEVYPNIEEDFREDED